MLDDVEPPLGGGEVVVPLVGGGVVGGGVVGGGVTTGVGGGTTIVDAAVAAV